MQFEKIERDKYGFATDKILDTICKYHYDSYDLLLARDDYEKYELLLHSHDIYYWCGELQRNAHYTHYSVLPKSVEY